ncbi:unnamed protein product [Boreogadus saida]
MPTDRTITCHIFILFLLTSVTVILFCTAPLHNLIVTLAALGFGSSVIVALLTPGLRSRRRSSTMAPPLGAHAISGTAPTTVYNCPVFTKLPTIAQ